MIPGNGDNLSFMFNDQIVDFGLKEFELVTGLNCENLPAVDKKKTLEPNNIRAKFFGNSLKITLSDFDHLFDNVECMKDDELLKLANLYFFESFLDSKQKGTPIHNHNVDLANDLSAFNSFPWGRISYTSTVTSMLLAAKSLEGPKRVTGYNLCGTPLAILAYIAEAIPQLSEAKLVEKLDIPLPQPILNWKFINRSHDLNVAAIFDDVKLEVLPPYISRRRPSVSIDQMRNELDTMQQNQSVMATEIDSLKNQLQIVQTRLDAITGPVETPTDAHLHVESLDSDQGNNILVQDDIDAPQFSLGLTQAFEQDPNLFDATFESVVGQDSSIPLDINSDDPNFSLGITQVFEEEAQKRQKKTKVVKKVQQVPVLTFEEKRNRKPTKKLNRLVVNMCRSSDGARKPPVGPSRLRLLTGGEVGRTTGLPPPATSGAAGVTSGSRRPSAGRGRRGWHRGTCPAVEGLFAE